MPVIKGKDLCEREGIGQDKKGIKSSYKYEFVTIFLTIESLLVNLLSKEDLCPRK